MAGKKPLISVRYTAPLLATVYALSCNQVLMSCTNVPSANATCMASGFNKHSSSQLRITPIFVSGEIFKLIMILGYSDVKSKSYIHLYKPGTGGITYAPANASASVSSSMNRNLLFGATNPLRFKSTIAAPSRYFDA